MSIKLLREWKLFHKIVSLSIAQIFLISNISFANADVGGASSQQLEPLPQKVSIDKLDIPLNCGTINEKFTGKGDMSIIHIQDAHCNYSAQMNIARIIDELIKKYDVSFVAVEGADSTVETTWFRAFPNDSLREQAADHFLRKGNLTGPEYLSITGSEPFTIYGAENRKEYIENLNAFLEGYACRGQFGEYYANIRQSLGRLKSVIYSRELMELDEHISDYSDNKIKLEEHVAYLNGLASEKGISLSEYPSYSLLLSTMALEKGINFETVNRERAAIIEDMSEKVDKRSLAALVAKSSDFKNGRISNYSFYVFLSELANKNGISIERSYPDLFRYMAYLTTYSGVDNECLFEEIDSLISEIKARMFAGDDQRRLDRLWKNSGITLDFMALRITNREYAYYNANKDEFSPAAYTGFINAQSDKYGLALKAEMPGAELERAFGKLLDFYAIAVKRDRILLENTFKGMAGKKARTGVLITGGFHTGGMTKYLKEKDISYAVIVPAMTIEGDDRYMSVLTGGKTPYQPFIPIVATASLQVANMLSGMCLDPQIRSTEIRGSGLTFLQELAVALVTAFAAEGQYELDTSEGRERLQKLVLDSFRAHSRDPLTREGADYIIRQLSDAAVFDAISAAAALAIKRSAEVASFGAEAGMPEAGEAPRRSLIDAAGAETLERTVESGIVTGSIRVGSPSAQVGLSGGLKSIDEVFALVALKAGIADEEGRPNLNIRHNVEYGHKPNTTPTCQIFPGSDAEKPGQLVVEFHGSFDRDYAHISENNVVFDLRYTNDRGEPRTRTVNLADSLAFKLALHEMHWAGRSPGHAYAPERGSLILDSTEAGKSEAARFIDDVVMLWYKASYAYPDRSIRMDQLRLARYLETVLDSEVARYEFPRLVTSDQRMRALIVGLALNINRKFFLDRNVSDAPTPVYESNSIYGQSGRVALAASTLELMPEESDILKGTPEQQIESLQELFYSTRSLAELGALKLHPNAVIQDAAKKAEGRVKKARVRAFGDESAGKGSMIFAGQDLRGEVATELPYDVVYDMSLAFLRVIRDKLKASTGTDVPNPTIVLGNDIRLTSPRIRVTVEKALTDNGAKVVYIGEENLGVKYNTTPMVSWAYHNYATEEMPIHATIMITASHLASQFNGLKFTIKGEDITRGELLTVLRRANKREFYDTGITKAEPLPAGERVIEKNCLTDYKRFLLEDLSVLAGSLNGKKVVVDPGNGTAGFYADVLEELGVAVDRLYCDPDGRFPNHIADPNKEEAVNDLVARVRGTGADLGIAFDSDGDRVAFIDKFGNRLNGQALLRLLGEAALDQMIAEGANEEDLSGVTIIGNNKSSMIVREGIVSKGAKFAMANTGYVYVRNEALKRVGRGENVIIAGEESGHIMFRDNAFIDDGMYTASQVLKAVAASGKTLDEIVGTYRRTICSEVRNEMGLPGEIGKRPVDRADMDLVDADKAVIPKGMRDKALQKAGGNKPGFADGTCDIFMAEDNANGGLDERSGVRLGFTEPSHGADKAWVLFRASLTDPQMISMVEGRDLKECLNCAKAAWDFVIPHQDRIDPRPLVAFKQGLEIADELIQAELDGLDRIISKIFRPMAGTENDLQRLDKDAMVDPLLVAIRMDAVRQGLSHPDTKPAYMTKDDIMFGYFSSLVNQHIAFMQRPPVVDIDWKSHRDLKKAKGLLDREYNEARNYLAPKKAATERAWTLKSLALLYGEDVVSAEIGRVSGSAADKSQAEEMAIKNLLLAGSVNGRPSLRSEIEKVIKKDILGGQRTDQDRAEALSLRFLKAVANQLAGEEKKPLSGYDEKGFYNVFNKHFGFIIVSLGGGFGARYSPMGLNHKGHVSPMGTGISNTATTLLGATQTLADAPVSISVSDFSVFQNLSDEIRHGLMYGTVKYDRDLQDLRPPDKESPITKVLDPAHLSEERVERNLPPNSILEGQNVHGYGGGFTGQVEKNIELQRAGQMPDVPYHIRFDVEACGIQDQSIADVVLVTWMEAVAENNLMTIGLKDEIAVADKGVPADLTLFGGGVRHLQDWRNKPIDAKKRALLMLLRDLPENKELRDLVSKIEHLAEEEVDALIETIHTDTTAGQRHTVPINANVVVMHRDMATIKHPNPWRKAATGTAQAESTFIEMVDDHPDLQGQVDSKKGILESTPADSMVALFDWYAINKPGARIPVGYARFAAAPDGIKNTWRQNEFNRFWQLELRRILEEGGVDISELDYISLNPGPEAKVFTLASVKESLFGSRGVFQDAAEGRARGIKLSGKVHLDLTSKIRSGSDSRFTEINNSAILGYCHVGRNCKVYGSTVRGAKGANNSLRTIGRDSEITDSFLMDNLPLSNNSRFIGENRMPMDSASADARKKRKEAIEYVYRKSGEDEGYDKSGSYGEMKEVLLGEELSQIESVLLQEVRNGERILGDLKELREQDTGEEDKTIDLARAKEPQYVIRQLIANMGLLITLLDADPAIVGQPLTLPLAPGDIKLSYNPDGALREATESTVQDVLSMFGKKQYDMEKKQILRIIDQIVLAGKIDIRNKFTRIGNGTYLDRVNTEGRLYVGNGWGVQGLTVPRKGSAVILGDHKLVMARRVTSYEPAQDGQINSLTLLRDCTILADRVYIGAGAGQWLEDGKHTERGKVLRNVRIKGKAAIIPEGADIKEGTFEGIRQEEDALASTLLVFHEGHAYKLMKSILSGDEAAVSKAGLTMPGRFTSVATALCILVQDGQPGRAKTLINMLKLDSDRKDAVGERTKEAEADLKLYTALINRTEVIAMVVDPETVYRDWFVRSGIGARPPTANQTSYAQLKVTVRGQESRYRELFDKVTSLAAEGINPQLMVVRRPVVEMHNSDGSTYHRKSKNYTRQMVALSDYGDWFEMGMAIQRYSLLKDPDQILAILNAYGQYVNFVKAPERGRGELDAKKSALGALIAPERGAGLSDEEIVALYVAAFGPESYIGVTLRNQIPFDLGCFRGGRGANWFLKEVRRQLGLMGIGGHDLAMNMFPGATDDGRSWLLASLMFHSPGMPDIGKCLMDGALDGELAAILGGTRFSNIASLANFNKTFAGQATQGEVVPSAIRMAQYGQVSQKNAPKVKAINGYVAAFNRRLDEMRKGGMAVAEAKEILVHTLTELRECILQDKTKAEPEKVWGAFVGNILAYFAKSHPEMVQRNGEGAIIGLTDTTLWEMLNPTRNQGHLLCDLRLDPEERVLALEEKLEHVLNQLIRDGKEQIVRDLLYAEFCANVEIPKYDMPLRSMTLVGAQICFNEAIDALPGGTAPSSALLTLSKPAPDHPDGFLSPEERAEIDGEISILIEAGSTSADIAWYLTIREMETFLDVQGRVHPVTLRRYHLAGLAYQTDKNGTPTTRIQFLPSEDAYNEIPKVGPFQKTVIRERPVLDAAQKEALRKAINDGDIQGVIEVLVPSEKVAPNPLAEIALRNSRLLLMFPTTLVSNIGSAILTPEIGAAVKDNKVALMIYIHNALFENDPPGTTAATMMEDLYRFLSVQHRADLQAEKGTSEPDWDMVADYMTYVLLREPALYTAYESHYVPSDRDGVRERTGDKVSAVGLDVEDPKMSSKGRFLAPPLIRAVLQLNQFKELGFGIMSDGTISAFSDSHPGPVVDDPQGLSGIVAKNWSRLTGLPIQDAARFGDDAGMPGEGDLTPQNVFPQAVQADDRAEAIDGTRYLLDIDASGELAAGDSSVETLEEAPVSLITSDARDAKVEIVGIADGFIRTRYTMAMVGSVKVDALARSSDHMLSVEKGSIRIVDRTGKFLRDGDGNIITLKSGDRKMVSAGLGEYTLVSTDDEARVYTGHIPQGPEKTIVKTFQTAKAYSAKLNGEKIDYIMPKEAFRGDEKRDLEQVLRIKLGIDARIITFNSEVGFSDIRAGSLRADARQVLLGTVANYENADTETGVEGAILLKAVKLPALPDVSGLRENGMYYNLEMLAAGSVLSAVRVVDKKVDKKDLEQLGVLFSQFTGRAVGASDIYFMMSFDEVKDTDLLPADQRSIQAVVNFIKGLLMNMPAMPVDARAELESRRQALWSA